MTISYNGDISSSRTFSFLRIICRWKGSIWKSVFVELLSWVIMYYVIMASYRYFMSEYQRRLFAKFAQYSNATIDYLPLTFMLGFFVSIVVDRWKNIFANIGFIDDAAIYISAVFLGQEEKPLQMRRNVLRYMVLTQVLVLRDISLQVRKRFPSLDSIVNAGFMMPHERQLMDVVTDKYNRYWLPIHWACSLAQQAKVAGYIAGDAQTSNVLREIIEFRSCLQVLCNYDWVPVPLAYPQVVFMAVRMYFMLCLICRQFLYPGDTVTRTVYTMIDLKIPVMTILQFIFYMGWLKVAEALLNPLGEDDDDLECNYIIDRNATIAMYLAGPCNGVVPEQKADCFSFGFTPLYSEEASNQTIHPLIGSAATIMPDLVSNTRMVPKNDDDTSSTYSGNTVRNMKNMFGLRNRFKSICNKKKRTVKPTGSKRYDSNTQSTQITNVSGSVPITLEPENLQPSSPTVGMASNITLISCGLDDDKNERVI
ncbi:unnamed protein product [Bursaphelenchus okinawaensis]|uniref:Bestrophin homolog n=1 Tax=Bursaphelenchus okinawaensis TaxID=465554 RepID=A0A811KYB5_9BILA|nr:unnamed protein product [Bursaphelenchus okinawaensis]CAG9114507.1 unnamed protein product [Bursaphelenchus okinawaensis]